MKKVLVTGGYGLVGKSIQELTLFGDVPIDGKVSQYEYVFLSSKECDLRDSVACERLFSDGKFDTVIHLANVVAGLYGNINNNYTMFVDNLKINTNILECCKKNKVKRLINILSTCVFGNDLKYPLTSNQMYDKIPDSSNEGYSYSKRLLATGSKLLTTCSDIEIVSLIPTNIFGKYDNFNIDNGHVFPVLIAKTFNAKKNLKECATNCDLMIKGTASCYRQFIYGSDFAKIILHFVDCKLEKQFNQLIVGPSVKDEITIKELINKIVKEFDFNGRIIYDSSFPEGQHKKTVSDMELLEYIPNFKFTPLNVALKETINYFIENYDSVRK
jgi:GDP-L-fucose synthase